MKFRGFPPQTCSQVVPLWPVVRPCFVQSQIFWWLLINERSQVCTYTAEAVVLQLLLITVCVCVCYRFWC